MEEERGRRAARVVGSVGAVPKAGAAQDGTERAIAAANAAAEGVFFRIGGR